MAWQPQAVSRGGHTREPLGQRKSIERAVCRKERLDGSPTPLVHVISHWSAVEGNDQPRAILGADPERAKRSVEAFFEQRKVAPHRLVDHVAAEVVELRGGGQHTTRHPIDNRYGTDIGIGVGGQDGFAPGPQLNGQQCRLVAARVVDQIQNVARRINADDALDAGAGSHPVLERSMSSVRKGTHLSSSSRRSSSRVPSGPNFSATRGR